MSVRLQNLGFGAVNSFVTERVTVTPLNPLHSADTGIGVEVVTDSEEIAEQIRICRRSSLPIDSQLLYLTLQETGITNPLGVKSTPMLKGVPGELAITPDLTTYALSGPVKFGTIISIAYGIRSLLDVYNFKLGLHASLLHDRYSERSHIFVGESGAGKTTTALMLQALRPDRFLLTSDDWIEVDVEAGRVSPISTTIGTTSEVEAMRQHLSPPFYSFGKTFYPLSFDFLAQFRFMQLGEIINLSPLYEGDTFEMQLRRINNHVPFMNQDIGHLSAYPAVKDRVEALIAEGVKLLRRGKVISNVKESNPTQLLQKIDEIIKI